jgi:SAM-dependent methyltransferase
MVCTADTLNLPFPDESFDLIILNMVFPYFAFGLKLPDRNILEVNILKSFQRLLRKDGRLYITVRNKHSLHHLLKSSGPNVMVLYRFNEFRRLLESSGFSGINSYWVIPNYKFPEEFLPLDRPVANSMQQLAGLPTFALPKVIAAKAFSSLHSLHYLAETIAFVAHK